MDFALDAQAIFQVLMGMSLGGVSVALLVLALVQTAKMFGLKGTHRIRGLAVGLGVFFVAIAYGLQESLIPGVAAPYITWGVVAIAGGLAAMGLWELGERWLPGKEDGASEAA